MSVQDVPSKMMLYEDCIKLATINSPAERYWQAQEHLKPLLLHPEWECFALKTLLGQTRTSIWKLNVQQRLRYDDEQSPQLQPLQDKLDSLTAQLADAETAQASVLAQQVAHVQVSREEVHYDPSLSTVQQLWDQFWQAERQLAQGCSYKNKKSMKHQSKLRHGLIAWVLLQVGVAVPAAQGNTPGPFAPLWQVWSIEQVQTQLNDLETRLQSIAPGNKRTGRLGKLKSVLAKEVLAMQSAAQ